MNQFWRYMTSEALQELDKSKSLVLLPIAATEQHGAHLPVGTDAIILEKLMEKFVAEKKFKGSSVLVAPQIHVGKSNEHMGFAGTMTLTAHTLYDVIHEMCESIAKSGFHRIILTNSHGGNTDLLNLIARDLRIDLNLEIYVFDWWFTPFWQDILSQEKQSESIYGVFHACELETSLMMAIAPETVQADRITDEVPDEMFRDNHYISLFGPINMGWKTKDVTQSGVIGSPKSATKEKGEKFMQYAVDKLAQIVEEILSFRYSSDQQD